MNWHALGHQKQIDRAVCLVVKEKCCNLFRRVDTLEP